MNIHAVSWMFMLCPGHSRCFGHPCSVQKFMPCHGHSFHAWTFRISYACPCCVMDSHAVLWTFMMCHDHSCSSWAFILSWVFMLCHICSCCVMTSHAIMAVHAVLWMSMLCHPYVRALSAILRHGCFCCHGKSCTAAVSRTSYHL